jgi:hypothetical protein
MDRVMSLAGNWQFQLDESNTGITNRWFDSVLADDITLPGSTDEAGFGTKNVKMDPHRLSRLYEYTGAAWYQKDITIPDAWVSKHISLYLERCHWETRVWVDGKEAGMQDSLCIPHEYDLSSLLSPGEHRLTIRVDNTIQYNVGINAHSITKETQTNWNGIVGDIRLKAADPVSVQNVQIFPNIRNRSVKVSVALQNDTDETVSGRVILIARSFQAETVHQPAELTIPFIAPKGLAAIETVYLLGEGVQLWDEFFPVLYTLNVKMEASSGSRKFSDSREETFGMREFSVKGTQFSLNGKPVFLRGTLECCVFPRTGYPDTDLDSWTRIFAIAKSHGLNHFRFHSWCPPEAAFQAADRAGFMLQIETPVWTVLGEDPEVDQYIYDEGDRILKTYGNHPSFCMLAVGNEPSGKNQEEFLSKIVAYWKNKDSRHVYTGCAGWPELPGNDYQCLKNRNGVIRSQDWAAELEGRLNKYPLTTDFDFSEQIAGSEVPIVSHEIGQWCVYPNLNEIEKYDGILRARNIELVKKSLTEKGMTAQHSDFLAASGKLQAMLYKEDIEAALRTPGFGGFQLLGLTDFPGQGTALVGVLDTFWDSKGYISNSEFREFCSETVPLLRMDRVVWKSSETFQAKIQIAHFGAEPIKDAVIKWSLSNESGEVLASGKLDPVTLPVSNDIFPGEISIPLNSIQSAEKLTLTLEIKGTPYHNYWNIWVYPEKVDTTIPEGVVIAHSLSEAKPHLEAGRKVLLIASRKELIYQNKQTAQEGQGNTDLRDSPEVPAGFTTIFWNTQWTHRQKPHTLGILCSPEHLALEGFVTDSHSNWHWFDLIKDAHIFVLDSLPGNIQPIVQVIDDWNRNYELGLLFEAAVGNGKLLVSGMDLTDKTEQRPVARQMLRSLLDYMAGDEFAPENPLELEEIERILNR